MALLGLLARRPDGGSPLRLAAWRRRWKLVLGAAFAGLLFLVLFNVRGTPADRLLDPLRGLPYIERLARITESKRGTGRVRVLTWDGTLQLMGRAEPLGIPGDSLAGPDRSHALRAWIGYGPESLFNTFAAVYPPELAHLERRDRTPDRAHNETLERLATTGALGWAADRPAR